MSPSFPAKFGQTRTQRIGELFCGPGGLGAGARLANGSISGIQFQHAWASDYDIDSCKTFALNNGADSNLKVFHKDVRELDVSSLPDIDGFNFGFPCNDFSSVGKQLGLEGKFGPLYTYGVEVLRAKQPDWFIAENVSGLRAKKNANAFHSILREFQASGYNVTPHLYRFEEYGVPQRRHRILVVGFRSDLKLHFHVPTGNKEHEISARVALEVPPISADTKNHEFGRVSETVRRRLQQIAPGKNAFNSNLSEDLKLNVVGAQMSQIYRRLEPDKPAYTVTGSGGGGTHVYHWEEDRPLTNRERARLQTFPDDFEFVGSISSVRKQIGMAVPVKASQAIHIAIARTLMGESYEWERANLASFLSSQQLPMDFSELNTHQP